MNDFDATLRRRLQTVREALAAAQEAADDHGVLTHAAEAEELERLAALHGVEVPAARTLTGTESEEAG